MGAPCRGRGCAKTVSPCLRSGIQDAATSKKQDGCIMPLGHRRPRHEPTSVRL
jgi:hypothetical protein